jgi:hypothetical protein
LNGSDREHNFKFISGWGGGGALMKKDKERILIHLNVCIMYKSDALNKIGTFAFRLEQSCGFEFHQFPHLPVFCFPAQIDACR